MTSRAGFISTTVAAALLVASASAVSGRAQTESATKTAQSRFPEGPGREALFKVCKECHGPESVLGQLKTREEWDKTLNEMAANGAYGTDEEWTQILDYLATNFSLILVNKADAKELAPMLGVPPAVAESIVAARTEKGGLKTIDDLKAVPGVDAAKIDARRDRLVF